MITLKRIYDEPKKEEGFRILIDRLWARGLSKEKAKVDLWLKEIAPSDKLRKWFSHDPKKWKEFIKRYETELKSKSELVQNIKQIEKDKKIITLLYSAKDREYNNGVVLKNFLEKSR